AMKALQRDPALRYATAAEMARDLDAFVVASRLHVDDVVLFLREVEPLVNAPRPSIADLNASSMGTITTEPSVPTTKDDLVHPLRMSPLALALIGSRKN